MGIHSGYDVRWLLRGYHPDLEEDGRCRGGRVRGGETGSDRQLHRGQSHARGDAREAEEVGCRRWEGAGPLPVGLSKVTFPSTPELLRLPGHKMCDLAMPAAVVSFWSCHALPKPWAR